VRLRRLQSDYEAIRRLVRVHPHIKTEGVSGNPPEVYRLFLSVRSLQQRGEELFFVDQHRLEITLPRGYPRDAPTCRMLTPVFHPNIAPHAVCIGDHWSAAQTLDQMIQRVGEMLAFQSYNTKSPLNGSPAHRAVTPPRGDRARHHPRGHSARHSRPAVVVRTRCTAQPCSARCSGSS